MNNFEHAARLTELTDMGAHELAKKFIKLERIAQMDKGSFVMMCEAMKEIESAVGIDSGGFNGPVPAINAIKDLVIERDAAIEREAALAAHVEALRGALLPLAHGGASKCIAREDYSVMRERIKDWLGVRDFKRAREAFNSTPTTSLARRDLIKQAEELEKMLKVLQSDIINTSVARSIFSAIELRVETLRQQASTL